jgi:hypothetical protein
MIGGIDGLSPRRFTLDGTVLRDRIVNIIMSALATSPVKFVLRIHFHLNLDDGGSLAIVPSVAVPLVIYYPFEL